MAALSSEEKSLRGVGPGTKFPEDFLTGMGVASAGMEKENTGHHHLLVGRLPLGKGEDGEEEFDFSLPADENHLHFVKGQTETQLKLTPGTHTLQLILP